MSNPEKHTNEDKKRFSIIAQIKSLTHASRGLRIFFKTTHNAWVQIFFGLLAICLSITLRISSMEWIAIIFCIGLVLIAEAFNTAIEIDIDLTSPDFHPYARDTKDVAAAAVLLSVITAIAIGLIIFLPKIFNLLLFTS